MGLYLGTTIINKKEEKVSNELINKLHELFEFDHDHTGKNGEECLWDITVCNGFKSNIAYLVHEFNTQKATNMSTINDLVLYVIETLFDNDSYYNDYCYHIEKINSNDLYVSVTCVTQ